MSEQLTINYNFYFGDANTGNAIGIVRESTPSYGGDKEEVSGLDNVVSGLLRKKTLPVDGEVTLSWSGIVDTSAEGYSNFDAAMKNRTSCTLTVVRGDGSATEYTGYRDTYDPETVSRGEATVKFSLTFDSNSEKEVSAPESNPE